MFRLALSLSSLLLAFSVQAAPAPSAPVTAQPAQRMQVTVTPGTQPKDSKPDRHWEFTVAAGPIEREAQVVMVRLPRKLPVTAVKVREASGAKVVAQVPVPNVVAFRIKPIKAGGQAVYLVDEDPKPGKPDKSGMQAVQNRDGIKIAFNGRPVLGYVNRPAVPKDTPPVAARGGYLHPLYSPAGVLVTEDFPKDKPFQHGVWTTWQKIEGAGSQPDFWDLTQGKGRVSVESMGPLWGGPLTAGFEANQFFTDFDKRKGMTVLRDAWEVKVVRESERATVVDLVSAQETVNGPVTLGKNPFGGILVRGNRDWQGDKATFMTSEGQERGQAMGAPARWCYLGGKSGGKQAGIAILAHPSNPKSGAVFIDPVDPVMGFALTAKEPMTIPARGHIRLRYRYVVLDGAPDSKLFDRLWTDFATPVETVIRTLGE